MGLVSQAPYGVAADGSVEFVCPCRPRWTSPRIPKPPWSSRPTAPVITRAEATAAQAGELPRSVDSVDLPLATLPGPHPTRSVPPCTLETTTRTPTALQLAQPGLYPVVIELRDAGAVLAELLTFIHRLPSATDVQEVPLPVAIAMTTTAPVVLDDNAKL